MQGPLIRHINEDPASWAELWQTGVRLGAIPYYMFVERDTGPREYFQLPLARARDFPGGLPDGVRPVAHGARAVDERFPGKVVIDGVAQIGGRRCLRCSSCRRAMRTGCASRFTPSSIRTRPGWTS
jgi:hypothetical protein